MAAVMTEARSSPGTDGHHGHQQNDNEMIEGDRCRLGDVMEASAPRRLGIRMIADGDTVIVVESKTSLKAVKLTAGQTFQNRYGLFQHSDWIGRPFGSRVTAVKGGGGYVHLLAPCPALWTTVLPHRTQILYLPDISLLLSLLHVTPGCTVLESGTGSASLTHSLARAVAPNGGVHSFEFHEGRAEHARADLQSNGMSHLATVTLRDIQSDGFPPELHGRADAVFLDLPSPWLVTASVARCLKPDAVVCSFSPCIEQVQRFCESASQLAFTEVRTVEVLCRSYDVREETMRVIKTCPPSPLPYSDPTTRGTAPSADPTSTTAADAPTAVATTTGVHTDTAEQQVGDRSSLGERAGDEASDQGRVGLCEMEKREGVSVTVAGAGSTVEGRSERPTPPTKRMRKDGGGRRETPSGSRQNGDHVVTCVTARPWPETKGHTGYLTFARKAV